MRVKHFITRRAHNIRTFLCDDHAVLRDGTYNVFIVDAEHASAPHDALRLELVVIDGAHQGDVVSVIAQHLHVDAVRVLGLPATLIVEHGVPRVELG